MVLLPAAALGLRILGFRRTRALLLPGSSAPEARRDLPRAQTAARIVHGAAPWSPLRANCLPRALVLGHLLRRQGLEAELCLGAAKPGGAFAAHAWVEHDGVALAEADDTTIRFAALGGPSYRRSV
jgi:hypothetical protein